MTDMLLLQVAGTLIRDQIPKEGSLEDRVLFAMRYTREHASDILWMTDSRNEDLQFRSALAGVMLAGSEEDKAIITRSMQPLRALSALLSGVPVDLSQVDLDERNLPLMKMWHETAEEKK